MTAIFHTPILADNLALGQTRSVPTGGYMDLLKMMRVYSAVLNLVAMAKTASADGQITAVEARTILVGGLAPILDLFGVKLPLEGSPELQVIAAQARERDRNMVGMLGGVFERMER